MINIQDRSVTPELTQLCEFVGNDAFDALRDLMQRDYQAVCKIEYSGDNALLGWNVKYQKAGRTLCTVYPRNGHFFLLLVVGKKEKPQVEALLPTLCEKFRQIYLNTQEGMGQRWLLFDLSACDDVYADILRVVRIRRESR